MAAFSVVYWMKRVPDRQRVLKAIAEHLQEVGETTCVNPGCWLIDTQLSADDLFRSLFELVDRVGDAEPHRIVLLPLHAGGCWSTVSLADPRESEIVSWLKKALGTDYSEGEIESSTTDLGSNTPPEPSREEPYSDPRKFAEFLAEGSAETQRKYGYRANYTFESLAEVDRLISEHSAEGEPVSGGYFDPPNPVAPNIMSIRLYGLGLYVGEVLVRNSGGNWHTPSSDPKEWLETLEVVFSGKGASCNPIGKVFKRFHNGEVDSVAAFRALVLVMCAGGKADTKPGAAPDPAPSRPKAKKPKQRKDTGRKRPRS